MWKTILIVVAAILILGLMLFGWEKVWSYGKGAQQVLNEEVDEKSPMRLEGARIRALMQKESETVLAYEDRICDLEARREATARATEEARRRLRGEEDLLKRIKGLLEKQLDQYTIGRSTYTYAEVNADALDRIEAVKRMREDIAFKESLVADLDRAIKQGRGSLAEARKRLEELEGAMARLEARNANAEVRLEVARLTSAIAGAPLAADSELEKACRNYERRVVKKERRADARLSAGNSQFRIDYSAAMVTQDATAEIGRLLDENVPAQQEPPTAADRPSASEALEAEDK